MAINNLLKRRRGILSGNVGTLVLWNQLAPNLFDTSESWCSTHLESSSANDWNEVTYSNSEKAFYCSTRFTGGNGHIALTYKYTEPNNIVLTENHIYFSNCMVKLMAIGANQAQQNLTRYYITYSYGAYYQLSAHPLVLNQWKNCSTFFKYKYKPDTSRPLYYVDSFILSYVSSFKYPLNFYIKAPTLIDLTIMFADHPELMPSIDNDSANDFYNYCIKNGIDLTSYQPRNTSGSIIMWEDFRN